METEFSTLPGLVVAIGWATWFCGSVIAAFAAGAWPGLLRGVAATVVLWTGAVWASYAIWGPSCPLEMGAVPHGMAAVISTAATAACAAQAEPSFGLDAGWMGFIGAGVLIVTAGGGLIGGGVRWAVQRRPPLSLQTDPD